MVILPKESHSYVAKENILQLGMNSFNYRGKDVGSVYFSEYLTIDTELKIANEKFNEIGENILDFPNTEPDLIHKINTDFYKKTFCSIIAESHYEKETIHLTEKTWKTIMNGHPFMILGNPKILTMLKHEGFKTFDAWFDESYDESYDLYERVKIITKNLIKYSTYTIDDLKMIRKEMAPIIEYNYNHLLSVYSKKYIIYERGITYTSARKPHCDILLDILENWN
jgi:hypothetical protein